MERINRKICMNESEYVNASPEFGNVATKKCDSESNSLSRRSFLQSALAAAGMLLIQEQKAFPESAVASATAQTNGADFSVRRITLHGL